MKINSNVNEIYQEQFNLDQFKQELKALFQQGQKPKVLSKLFDLYQNHVSQINLISINEFYEIIGELLNTSPEYFMDKFYKSLIKRTSYSFSEAQQIEMERYIREKYSFFEGEKLLNF